LGKKAFYLRAVQIVQCRNRVCCRAPAVFHSNRVHARQASAGKLCF